MSTINSQKFDRELKKGGAELLVLRESFVAAINRVTRPENA